MMAAGIISRCYAVWSSGCWLMNRKVSASTQGPTLKVHSTSHAAEFAEVSSDDNKAATDATEWTHLQIIWLLISGRSAQFGKSINRDFTFDGQTDHLAMQPARVYGPRPANS